MRKSKSKTRTVTAEVQRITAPKRTVTVEVSQVKARPLTVTAEVRPSRLMRQRGGVRRAR